MEIKRQIVQVGMSSLAAIIPSDVVKAKELKEGDQIVWIVDNGNLGIKFEKVKK